jgi:hypothetical protein
MTWGADALRPEELIPAGGQWSGLLFENPRTGFPLSLVWTFSFAFEAVEREFGETGVSVEADWVPLPGATWQRLSGSAASSTSFGQPIEASVYFFDHHRFDGTHVEIVEQDQARSRARASLSGDIDSLGLDSLAVEAWLDFSGIYVQPQVRPSSVDAARALLGRFTDPAGLIGTAQAHNYVFRPGQG